MDLLDFSLSYSSPGQPKESDLSLACHFQNRSPDMPYHERLKSLGLYSLQRRRERYCIIYIWKIIEGLAPNFSNPITSTFSGRRGRSCVISHVNVGRVGTLSYNSFRCRSIRLFNSLPMHLRSISSCSVLRLC